VRKQSVVDGLVLLCEVLVVVGATLLGVVVFELVRRGRRAARSSA